MNTKFIYTLSDPNTGLVRYIGKTKNIKDRLKRHLSNSCYVYLLSQLIEFLDPSFA